MPSFNQLLEQSMPFFAARAHGVKPRRIDHAYRGGKPNPENPDDPDDRYHPDDDRSAEQVIQDNLIWQFDHDPASPATFDDLRVWSRGMGMNYSHAVSVMRKIEVGQLAVIHERGTQFELPLLSEFEVGTWHIPAASIPASNDGLWQLEAKTDASMLVAFAFEQIDGVIVPMTMQSIEALGDAFMPEPGTKPPCPDVTVAGTGTIRICLESVRYLVLVSLTTCRERPDFAPGELVGFARFYPHVMVMSNDDLRSVEVSIFLDRPAKAMTHGDPEMMDEIKALLVTDSNVNHSITKPIMPELPLPITSNIYDYYEVEAHDVLATRAPTRLSAAERALIPAAERRFHEDHPEQRAGEVTFADTRFTRKRTLERCVGRDGGIRRAITKQARQGQFDSVHLAPRMRTEFVDTSDHPDRRVVLDDIAMVFVCMHDCVHTHMRWAAWASDKIVRGFDGDRPYAKSGAPTVPANQSVFISFPTQHSMTYRAIAEGCTGGKWSVFFHHGSGYAIGEWPTKLSGIMRLALRSGISTADGPTQIFPSMSSSWPEFYWRCRFTGDGGSPQRPIERLDFELEECLR